jgi:putative hydrolase of the HAD superfamily
MIRYILFDLDETLYPPSAGLMPEISARMNEYMMTRVGIPASDVAQLRQAYWERYGTTLRGLCIERHIDVQEFLNFVHDIRIEKYLQMDVRLDAMLAQLSQEKFVFTNAPANYARRVLRALGVEKHFTNIFDINFITYESKPLPSAYHHVLAALGARAQECLLIDDSARNLVPAKALGMRTVWLSPDHARQDGAVDGVIATIYDLPEILKEWS